MNLRNRNVLISWRLRSENPAKDFRTSRAGSPHRNYRDGRDDTTIPATINANATP